MTFKIISFLGLFTATSNLQIIIAFLFLTPCRYRTIPFGNISSIFIRHIFCLQSATTTATTIFKFFGFLWIPETHCLPLIVDLGSLTSATSIAHNINLSIFKFWIRIISKFIGNSSISAYIAHCLSSLNSVFLYLIKISFKANLSGSIAQMIYFLISKIMPFYAKHLTYFYRNKENKFMRITKNQI